MPKYLEAALREPRVRGALVGLCAAWLCASTPATVLADGRSDAERVEVDEEFLRHRSTLEAGVVIPTDDSYRVGDFVGLEKRQVDLLGSVDLRGQTSWDAETPREWRLQGSNVGLGSRRLRFEYGSQGRYGLMLHFDQIPKLSEDRGLVLFGSRGASTLLLPAGFVRGEQPADLATLSQSVLEPRVRHERRRQGGTLSFSPGSGWDVELGLDRETKQGTKLVGSVVGSNGGNGTSLISPEPVDHDDRKLRLRVRSDGRQHAALGELELRYERSMFDNRKRSLTWQVPFLPPAAGNTFLNADFASKGLAPDNEFQQLALAWGHALALQSRVTLDASYGTMTQDQTFQPYTINPTLSVAMPLPRASLHGRIETSFVRLHLVSRPLPKLQVHTGWRLDDRDNQTPQSTYQYVSNDTANQGALNSANARVNIPYSYRSNLFELGSSYDVGRRTTLGFDYAFEITDRTFTEVDTLRENRIETKLRSRLGKKLNLLLQGGYAGRRGSSYDGNVPFLDGRTPQFLATQSPANQLDNAPDLRRSYLADRVRTEGRARLSYAATQKLTLAWSARLAHDDYDRSELGLADVRSGSTTLDLAYDPAPDVHFSPFYTYQRVNRDDDHVDVGASFAGASNPARRYSESLEDAAHSVGFAARVERMGGKLVLEADYSFTRTSSDIDVKSGAALTPGTDLPDDELRRHDLRLMATYRLSERLQIRFRYLFAKLDQTDFAYEDVTPTTLPDVLTLGQGTPDHRSSIFALSVQWTLD